MKYKTRRLFFFIGILVLSVFVAGTMIVEGYHVNTTVPLNVYLTWETKDMPDKMRENVERLISQNPEMKFYFFDAPKRREFIKTYFDEEVVRAYDKLIPGSYKSDLWRFCVLSIHGGIYLDIKFSNVNGFKLIQLTDNEYFIPDLEDSGSGIVTGLISCKPGNEAMQKAIRRVVENTKSEYYGDSSLAPTGPLLLKQCLTDEELEKSQKNGLSLCLYNDNTSICLNGTPIMTVYDEYYKQDRATSMQPPYFEL
jgi:mannosyltransferase OCH1-like enzyme